MSQHTKPCETTTLRMDQGFTPLEVTMTIFQRTDGLLQPQMTDRHLLRLRDLRHEARSVASLWENVDPIRQRTIRAHFAPKTQRLHIYIMECCNSVTWRLGPPNGHLWVRLPARVVRMSAAMPDDAPTLASDTASKVETWLMSEARPRRSSSESAYEPRHWEEALIKMGRFRLTRSESEIDRDENLSSADLQMDDSCSGLDSTWSSEGSKVSEAGDSSPETHDSRSKVDAASSESYDEFPEVDHSMSEGDGASSDSESACSDDS